MSGAARVAESTSYAATLESSAATYDEGMNPRHRRLVIPVALGALILIVVLAAVL